MMSEFAVMVACNRSGGAHLKLGNVPYDEILSKKGRFLYNPNNCENNNLCFCLCLAHFKNAKMSESEKLEYAKQLHSDLGFDLTHRVSFSDVTKFEQHINAKIIVFHHAFNHKHVQCFQTHNTPSHNTNNYHDKTDLIKEEVLKNMPKRSRKNAEHILETLTRSKNLISWTDQGEIVVDNRPVRGSHLYDLVKSVAASHNVSDISRPLGWDIF